MNKIAKGFAIAGSSLIALFVAGGVAMASSYDFGTVTLKVGSNGAAVSNMQSALNACAGASLSTDGAFGPMTKGAVMAFQSSHSLTADGLFGNMSKAALNAACAGAPSTSTGGSTLSGGAGSVQEYKLLTSPTNLREVGEEQSDVKVLGLSVEADDASDLNIKAMKLDLNPASVLGTSGYAGESTSSDKFEDYADQLTIWYGSTQVASVDASDFNDDNSYVKTISFSKDAVVKAGQIGKFYVAIDGVNNLDSDDIGEKWAVDVTSVRWVDAQGATISEDPSTNARDFSFESFATANDVQLKFTTSSSTPDAQTVEADDNNSTDGVVLMKGTMKAVGSDIDLKELPVTVTPAGTGDASEIASQYTLVIDGDEIQSVQSDECTVTGDCDGSGTSTAVTYNFDDADFTINEGDTVNFEIRADINEIASPIAEGDSLNASVTGTNVGNVVAEDSTGEDVTDLTGSSIGEDQAFRSQGISISLVSASQTVTSGSSTNDDTATFLIKFKVSAFGEKVYIPNIASNTATNAIDFDVDTTGTASAVGGAMTDTSDSSVSANDNFDVEDGDTEQFTLTVTSGDSGAGLFRAALANVRWSTSDLTSGSATAWESFTFNLDDFKTDYVSLN